MRHLKWRWLVRKAVPGLTAVALAGWAWVLAAMHVAVLAVTITATVLWVVAMLALRRWDRESPRQEGYSSYQFDPSDPKE